MSKLILPSKAQIGDEVTFEIGTNAPIKAFVSAVKFSEDGDVSYDLRIPVSETDPDIQTRISDVSSSVVSVIVANTWQG